MNKKPKYEVVTINVAAGTAANTPIEDNTYKPDKDYTKVIGVAVSLSNPLADVTAPFVFIGINDSTQGVQHDDAPFEQFAASSAVNPNEKFKELEIPCDGRTVKSRVTTKVLSVSNFSVVFTYKVVDEDVEIARQKV
ncbi:hypothetical protein WSM22_02980 [Cytophagales bacterium WSM2-2]|nr:hypothetical protein WSM22_02980 [Cytophagales bacterium WSM2-2]